MIPIEDYFMGFMPVVRRPPRSALDDKIDSNHVL